VAGVRHLHRLGILHRDLRAANVLVAGMDPVHVLLADLGVGHLLSAFARGATAPGVTASKVTTKLTGNAAKGPLLYMAPETLAGSGPCICVSLFGLGRLGP
jgi:serine/threonine protein kinase